MAVPNNVRLNWTEQVLKGTQNPYEEEVSNSSSSIILDVEERLSIHHGFSEFVLTSADVVLIALTRKKISRNSAKHTYKHLHEIKVRTKTNK